MNGLNIEANPLPVFIVPIFAMRALIGLPGMAATTNKSAHDTCYPYGEAYNGGTGTVLPGNNFAMREKDTIVKTKIHGLSVSSGIMQKETKIEGVSLNAGFAVENEVSGIEVSSVVNWHYSFKGVIAALVNTTATGKGVQIGIYNDCRKGTLLQIRADKQNRGPCIAICKLQL